jgi:hypothetical protein
MPAAARQRVVRYAGGQEPTADVIVPSRLAEVHIHHVDLDIGAVTPATAVITGPGGELLAWLLSRSGGAALTREPAGALPAVPAIY